MKQISVTDTRKKTFRVTQYDEWSKGPDGDLKFPEFNKTFKYKVPPGYIIVGVRIPCNADLYSVNSVPICNVIIMKEHLARTKQSEFEAT